MSTAGWRARFQSGIYSFACSRPLLDTLRRRVSAIHTSPSWRIPISSDWRLARTAIAEPQHTAFLRRRGDTEARSAVYANRNGLPSAVAKQSMRQRAEIVERSFAHNLERGGCGELGCAGARTSTSAT